MGDIAHVSGRVLEETEKIIVGKRDKIRLIIMAVLAGGHVLLDDLPGVGKTTLLKTLSIALGCTSKRVQFVPDLLPSDICGMKIYNQKTGDFQVVEGPVMTNLLLADEINRAIPRTQSALLEAMEERQVTIDAETLPLPKPFLVLATENPVESESTFRLPAAQMDRFLIRLSLGYPAAEEETRMLQNLGDRIPFETVETVTCAEELVKLQDQAAQVYVSDAVAAYIVALAGATRSHTDLSMGASPRGSRGLYRAAKVWAAMEGRDYVTPDDVQYLAVPVLSHRLLLTGQARFSGKSAESVVREVLSSVEVPPRTEEMFRGR
ncbi:MoxR family ATPase [uncultured Oscillibacter sp.]|uniref:AAA family ATPase n=1 Tax=uncultured Oscillibacter sp. TaxID=876091 RepID=UPI00280590B7|nr:MoxR family ATPase [uncultured Oscillibacter sp.]